MCGIVGYIGHQDCSDILVEGLKRLEYRGYDSAGVAIFDGQTFQVRRREGKLANLSKSLTQDPLTGHLGIGHTRWATHGKPSEQNAHPHQYGGVVVVHNGIIENHIELRRELEGLGHFFSSETDTEIFCHLIYQNIKQGHSLETAVYQSLEKIRGSYAIACCYEQEPDKLIVAKNANPIVIGLGKNENFVASDIPAILNHTRDIIFLEEMEIAILTKDRVVFKTSSGQVLEKRPRYIDWTPAMAEKGGYKHFMLKEIFEQPRAIIDTLTGRISSETGAITLDEIQIEPAYIESLKKIIIIACGTSWHAALVGKFLIEDLCRIPVEVDLASEFRYRDPIVDSQVLLIAISQSGETADTLAAVKEAKRKGAQILSICNVIEASIAREAHYKFYTHAGPEIGVASTKAFTTQIVALYLLALHLALKLNKILPQKIGCHLKNLIELPQLMNQVLAHSNLIEAIAKKYSTVSDFLYLGRGINYPIALEGALKLKEISYIHAEGYPAGEMKHGPIALITDKMPVVVIAPQNSNYEKIMSNLKEVKAREGIVIAVATEGDLNILDVAADTFFIPACDTYIQPILGAIPMQLLAYYIADFKGTDVDQPRNLAKSVTVE